METRLVLLLIGVLLLAVFRVRDASAREYSPRVVSPHNADAYSMRTFGEYPRWRDLRGDARAWEMYRYLADTRTGLFHMNEVLEGQDVLSEYVTIRDPVKIINVYGYGYCGIFGPVMAGVCEGAGVGRARMLTLPLWNHVASEAFYDDKWHYLDIDVRAVFRRPDGTLASMQDAKTDPSLWTENGPLFFPNDRLGQARRIYQETRVEHYNGFHFSGHTMDYLLRQGETFTRWWKPQGGRWHHSPVYHETEWLRNLIEQEPRGPKPNHRHFTVHNHGNGRFFYAPNLTERSSDFRDGAYDALNVRPGKDGLTADGEGYAVFEIRSPYIIVPLVGRLETTEDDREASVVETSGCGFRLLISLDNGITWRDLGEVSGEASFDLTPYVSGTYGYLLKLALSGEDAVVRSLRVTTWVQVAPASLPSLRCGVNRMEYRTGDDRGLQTRVKEIRVSANDREELLKYCVEPPSDWDTSRKTSRIRGAFTVKVNAPPNAHIRWLSIGGSFQTHQREAARNTRNAIFYAADEPTDFIELYRADVPTDNDHWHYNADREVMLPKPAKSVYVRYVGDPAVNAVRIYAHCADDAEYLRRPVRIEHGWMENGQLRTQIVVREMPGTYDIRVEEEPEDEFIEMSAPSDD